MARRSLWSIIQAVSYLFSPSWRCSALYRQRIRRASTNRPRAV